MIKLSLLVVVLNLNKLSGLNSVPNCTSNPYEIQVSKLYTLKFFSCSKKMGSCDDTLFRRVGAWWTWSQILVGEFSEPKDTWEKVSYENFDELDVSCSCSLFETKGILCRHILCILWRNHVTHIPESYIFRDVFSIDLQREKLTIKRVEELNYKYS